MKKTYILTFTLIIFLTTIPLPARAQSNINCYNRQGLRIIEIQKGYVNISELSMGVGLGEVSQSYDTNQLGFTMVNGYHFNPHLMAGAGIGVESFNGGALGALYLDARYYFQLKCINPFVMADAGLKYRISGDDAKAGPFFFPAAGVRLYVCRKLALSFALGPYTHWVRTDGGRSTFLSIKLGAVFY